MKKAINSSRNASSNGPAFFVKMFRLSTVRYSIEKEAVDTTRKINIMSYQLFTKAADTSASMNESYEKKTLNFSTQQSHEAIESGNPPFLTNQISPISKPPLNKKEIYIQDDSHGETPSKFDRSGSVLFSILELMLGRTRNPVSQAEDRSREFSS